MAKDKGGSKEGGDKGAKGKGGPDGKQPGKGTASGKMSDAEEKIINRGAALIREGATDKDMKDFGFSKRQTEASVTRAAEQIERGEPKSGS